MYCSKCGTKIKDGETKCPKCDAKVTAEHKESSGDDTLKTVAKAFMIVGTVVLGFLIIPLCWTIPMTIRYWNACENKKIRIGVGFKVCTLLFVSLISGILMLCDKD